VVSPHSVTDGHLIVQDAQKAFGGRVDVLINNAGILRMHIFQSYRRSEGGMGQKREGRADSRVPPLPGLDFSFLFSFLQETSPSRRCPSRYVASYILFTPPSMEADLVFSIRLWVGMGSRRPGSSQGSFRDEQGCLAHHEEPEGAFLSLLFSFS